MTGSANFRDRISTVDRKGKRVWFYPKIVKGKLYKYRSLLSLLFLGLLFGGPFMQYNNHPLFLLNVLERKFILFGVAFWPQDFHLFALAMLSFIVFILLFTVVFGRVWCGWACPQTIFMEMVFRKIENFVEGNHIAQQKLDKGKWTNEKILRKSIKHFLFFLISFIIANTFLAYIIGIKELQKLVTEPLSEHIGGFIAILIFTGLFYFVFAKFRELVCIIVCPYGRLQGVLLDKKSIVVSYNYKRGEPRGFLKRNAEKTTGDCVDCNECVRVCPTGIDIRNGTQLECINCTACIDACDAVMLKTGREPRLIGFNSQEAVEQGHSRLPKTRILAYSSVLTILMSVLIFLLATRKDVEATLLRSKGTLYQEMQDQQVANLYNFELVNKTFSDLPVQLKVMNDPSVKLEVVGGEIKLLQDDIARGVLIIRKEKSDIKRNKTELLIGIYSGDKLLDQVKTSFLGPVNQK